MNLTIWEKRVMLLGMAVLTIAALAWSIELIVVLYIAIGYWLAHG